MRPAPRRPALKRSFLGGAARRFLGDVRGEAAVEYGLIAALIVVVCIAALQALGTSNSQNWQLVSEEIVSAGGGGGGGEGGEN